MGDRVGLVDNQHGRVRLTPSMIPRSRDFDVKDSLFFSKWKELPSPEQVRERATAQWNAGTTLDKRKVLTYGRRHIKPPPTLFEELGLVVKWGVQAMISEAQSVYAVRNLLRDRVPVPEIYGWRTDGEEKFIYMQYIRGETLEKVWDLLEDDEREAVCLQLRAIIENLRQLEQDPSDIFIGNVVRSCFYDRVLSSNYQPEAGPFSSVHEFHEWFVYLCRRQLPDPRSIPIEPFRHELSDDCAIKFTHGDLHRSNIIITATKPYRVLALVDWEQSGWLPEYWEARKAQWTSSSIEWSTKYLPMILDQYASTEDAWPTWLYVKCFFLEFKGNYDFTLTQRTFQRFLLGTVEDRYVTDTVGDGTSSQDTIARDRLESAAATVPPPGRSPNPFDTLAPNCQNWLQDYIIKLVAEGYVAESAISVLQNAPKVLLTR